MSFYISNLNVNDYNVPDLFRMFDLDYRAPPADPNVLKYKLFEKYQEFKAAPHISEMQKYRLMEFLKQAYQRIAFYKQQPPAYMQQPPAYMQQQQPPAYMQQPPAYMQQQTSPFLQQQQQQLTANPYYNRPNNSVNPYQLLNPYNTNNTNNTSNVRMQVPHNYNFSPNFYNRSATIGLGSINNSSNPLVSQRTPEITQTKPYKPVETLPQKYASGDLNVLQRKTILKTLNIDTLFRANFFSTKSTNCLIELPSPIKNVVSMKVTSIELPNTVYTFNVMNKTNVFCVVINDIKYCIYINEGNYTADELVTYLNDEIFGAPGAIVPEFAYIAVEFDSKYGKFIFKLSDAAGAVAPSFTFGLDFALPDCPDRSITLNMGWILGYRKARYTHAEDYNLIASTVKKVGFNPEGIYNSIGFKYLFMSVNEFKNNYNETIIPVFTNNSSLPIRDILARLVVASDKNSIVFDDSSDLVLKKREYFGPVVIDRLKVVLYDELGREVNLINMDYSFTVELECLYS